MDIHKFREKLKRYLRGESNETENALADAWYRSYADAESKVDDAEVERSRKAAWEKVNALTAPVKVYRFPIWRVAAAAVILASLALSVWKFVLDKPEQNRYYTVSTGLNDIKQLNLPDGSMVWLNAATSIQIPQHFEAATRQLILNDGEAFFDVKHDAKRPFIVKTGALKVQVLGTSFNIQSFKSLNNIKVGVATGKVGITRNGKTEAMLTPGQQYVFDTQLNHFNLQKINIEQLQGWKMGSTYFNESTFDEVALAFKNCYGMALKPADKKVAAYHFTLILKHGISEADALKLITQIHNTNYKKEGNEVLIYQK